MRVLKMKKSAAVFSVLLAVVLSVFCAGISFADEKDEAQMKDKLIFEVHVELDREHIIELNGPAGRVKMLPFTGTVEGELFNGIVAPWGVDTQITNQVNVRHMSARYMLVGKDNKGNDCKIYIDNNGWFTNGEQPKPFITIPTFYTDSPELSEYLHTNKFRGEGHSGDGKLTIKFFEIIK